jgi:hypothetical protein
MLTLRLTAFALSALQRLSSWLSPSQQQVKPQPRKKRGRSNSSASSSMTQIDDYPQGERFYVCHYENRFSALFVLDLSGAIPFPLIYETNGTAQSVFQVVQALRHGSLPDVPPTFICDPRASIKRAPKTWALQEDADL